MLAESSRNIRPERGVVVSLIRSRAAGRSLGWPGVSMRWNWRLVAVVLSSSSSLFSILSVRVRLERDIEAVEETTDVWVSEMTPF